MFFSNDGKKRASHKSSWVVGALAFIGAAGIVGKGRKLVKSACCKMKDMLHKTEEEM